MYQVAFPVLSRSTDRNGGAALRGRMVRLLTVVLFPLITVLAITAPQVIPWMFGAQWSEAVVPTQILCGAGAATLVIDAVGTTLMASGRPRALLGYGVAHFASTSTVSLISHWGLVAVAVAAVTVHTLFLVIAYVVLASGSPGTSLGSYGATPHRPRSQSSALAALATPVGWAISTAAVPGSSSLPAWRAIAAAATC